MNIKDYLCQLLGCGDGECQDALADCTKRLSNLNFHFSKLQERNRQLELLVPRPTPPEIDYVVEKDTVWVQSVLDGLRLGIIRVPLDSIYRMTNQKNFLNVVAWDWIDSIKYDKEFFDCENFAISFKAHVDMYFKLSQVGIVIDYKSKHGYNLVIYPDGNVHVLEPQSDALYVWPKRPEKFYSLKGAIVII